MSIIVAFGSNADNKTAIEIQRSGESLDFSLADVACSAAHGRKKPRFLDLPDCPKALFIKFFGRDEPFEVRVNRSCPVAVKLRLHGQEVGMVRCRFTSKKVVTEFFSPEATPHPVASPPRPEQAPTRQATNRVQETPNTQRPVSRPVAPPQRNGHAHSPQAKLATRKSAPPSREPCSMTLSLNEKRVPILRKDNYQTGIGGHIRTARSAEGVTKIPVVDGVVLEILRQTETRYFVRLASPDRLVVDGKIIEAAHLDVNASWRVNQMREASEVEFVAATAAQ